MAERRQRARVQGGWAAGPAGRPAAPKAPVASSLALAGARPAWRQKDQPHAQKQFVFEKPSEVERRVPEAGVIDKPGVYELSKGPTGISRIHLMPGFIESEQADWMFGQLLQDIPWGQRTHIRQELSFEEPRLTSWYGELPYTYSRITMQPNPNWHPVLTMLKERIEEFTGYTFNSLLCNLYRNEKDSVDWHSDDEPSLGENPVIASLSFGATRTFEMRKKPSPVRSRLEGELKSAGSEISVRVDLLEGECGKMWSMVEAEIQIKMKRVELLNWHERDSETEMAAEEEEMLSTVLAKQRGIKECSAAEGSLKEEDGDYTYVERLRIPLDHGTLLVMEGVTQDDWQHRVPKEYHSRDERINLTFRIIYPEPNGVWK